MWILRSSGASPFGRKAKIAAALCGLSDRITIEATDTTDPNDTIRQQNPLGKIPALKLEDGTWLYDSRVILEYFDSEAGGGIILPRNGEARFRALTLQALADGIMDAGILQIYEGRFRPAEKHHQPWLDHQKGKVGRALTVLETNPPALAGTPDVGQITLGCALAWMDFRFAGAWRENRPKLATWLDDFASAVPNWEATAPH